MSRTQFWILSVYAMLLLVFSGATIAILGAQVTLGLADLRSLGAVVVLMILILIFAELLVRFKAIYVTSLNPNRMVIQGVTGLLVCGGLLFWAINYTGPVQSSSFGFYKGGLDRIIGLGIPISLGAIYLGLRIRRNAKIISSPVQ